MSATATTEKKYLKWYQKLAYGSGDLASNCSYGLVSSFVLLYPVSYTHLDVYKRQVQSRPHFLYRPDGALLRGLLGAVHRNRAFDKDAPLYGILKRCTQQPMHLMDGGAGKEPLLLLFRQFLLLSLDIRTAGRFAQGRVEVFHVVGLKFLHLHAADIGDNNCLLYTSRPQG